jgi:hypothetical protein
MNIERTHLSRPPPALGPATRRRSRRAAPPAAPAAPRSAALACSAAPAARVAGSGVFERLAPLQHRRIEELRRHAPVRLLGLDRVAAAARAGRPRARSGSFERLVGFVERDDWLELRGHTAAPPRPSAGEAVGVDLRAASRAAGVCVQALARSQLEAPRQAEDRRSRP